MLKRYEKGKRYVLTQSNGVSQKAIESVIDSVIDTFNKTGVQIYSFKDFSVKVSGRVDKGYFMSFTRKD